MEVIRTPWRNIANDSIRVPGSLYLPNILAQGTLRQRMADLEHDPISYTALKVLQQRARNCTIPMCKEMADAAGIPWISSWPARLLRKIVGGKAQSGAYLQVRHDAMTHALMNYPENAILELAAGFGTRGVLEVAGRAAYIETDLQNLLNWKKEVVSKLRRGASIPNHYFRPTNVTDPREMEATGRFVGSLNLSQPLVIIHEGLLMYFSKEEQEVVRDNISRLMKSHSPGAIWLTSDFSESGGLECTWLPNCANPADADNYT